MSFPFAWNELADQPHNVAPKSERLRYHLGHAASYLELLWSNLRLAAPILANLARLRAGLYARPVALSNAFGLAVSPAGGDAVLDELAASGARETLLRVPSWEADKLDGYEAFARKIHGRGLGLLVALLQRRDDVLDVASWTRFVDEAFVRFGPLASHFEVGHAWNRTKWGLWSFREYVDLARPSFDLASRRGVKLVGPAVIDFEFHLYPPTLPRLPFDKVSSLLYVDRTGGPETRQFGWSAAGKAALLKAVVDASARPDGGRDVWVTEVNWPLKGTGPYSPAAGRPNVTEDEQASFLVRYYALLLAGGWVERIYWWQLAAPGYGLIDTRDGARRRRPAFDAFRTMVAALDGSVFVGRRVRGQARAFFFRKGDRTTAVAWSAGEPREFDFDQPAVLVTTRDGGEAPGAGSRHFRLTGSPLYVAFDAYDLQ
jgi:hypothetical protein